MKLLITGGAGFIGSALCRYSVKKGYEVHNVDKLTYAGNRTSLASIEEAKNYYFYQQDILNSEAIYQILHSHNIEAIVHLAAESHVDRSLSDPKPFIDSNILGTYALLEAARRYWESLNTALKEKFRFYHISTDEVFGDLPFDSGIFTEQSCYKPSSPYSASKAASDHLAAAWHHSYGLPILRSNCSNNYGPYHFPEKLIPFMIINALNGRLLPIYGEGKNIRDWLYVEDHVTAIDTILTKGKIGETYLIGTRNEQTNLDVVKAICTLLDELKPRAAGGSYHDLIHFVTDRAGHDRRYAIDPSKLERELGWKAQETFASGLKKTVIWYLEHEFWWRPLWEMQQF